MASKAHLSGTDGHGFCGKPSLYGELRDAICVLASLTPTAPSDSTGVEGFEEGFNISERDTTDIDIGEPDGQFAANSDEERLQKLKDELVDRLSEMLARFKSPRKTALKDAKNVSSVILLEAADQSSVTFICARNEGLDKQDKRVFLPEWKQLMEEMACSDDINSKACSIKMLRLVLDQQRQRIEYYIDQMRLALKSAHVGESDGENGEHHNESADDRAASLLGRFLESEKTTKGILPHWTDNHGLRYRFHGKDHEEIRARTAADSAWSNAKNLAVELDQIVPLASQICSQAPLCDTDKATALERLMRAVFSLWKTSHGRVVLESHITYHFKQRKPQAKKFHMSLLYLARILYGVEVFSNAARQLKGIQAISIMCMPYHESGEREPKRNETRMEISSALGISLPRIPDDIGRRIEKHLPAIRAEAKASRHIHAELQVLYHLDVLFPTVDSRHKAHPYIGCSRRCCFLCGAFIQATFPNMRTRGTHNAVIHRWEPQQWFTTEEQRDKFENGVRSLVERIRSVLKELFSTAHRRGEEHMAQSSHGLPSVATILKNEIEKMVPSRLQTLRMMTFQHSAVDDEIFIHAIPDKPGYADVTNRRWKDGTREMKLGEAEKLRIDQLRQVHGLEKLDQMPPEELHRPKTCRHCGYRPALFYCSACHTRYCGELCQKQNWHAHVFVCRVDSRPNQVDYLRLFLRRWAPKATIVVSRATVQELLADDELCFTFGFNACLLESEVRKLMTIFRHAVRHFRLRELQEWTSEKRLHQQLRHHLSRSSGAIHEPVQKVLEWYLEPGIDTRIDEACIHPVYQHHLFAVDFTRQLLGPLKDLVPLSRRSESARRVLSLYTKLLQPMNNVPGPLDEEWLEYGFCQCRTEDQRQKLRRAYHVLLNTTSLEEIIDTVESTGNLASLIRRDINAGISPLAGEHTALSFPRPSEIGAYRFVAEVGHILSGGYCQCFKHQHDDTNAFCAALGLPKRDPGSHLSVDSEVIYGFHAAEVWERWQLFNFYAHVFSLPKFDPRHLQAAAQGTARNSLEIYLDSLVPGFRMKLYCKYRTGILFPRLGGKLRHRDTNEPIHVPDYTVVHDVTQSLGLTNPWRLRFMTADQYGHETERDDDNI
ncbi:Uu.00g063800.m01.CDS01 [Anthostomella pinea]|uniref:Uu.00g063800.m01.CDS01 n=1 Tax=Anthostomella pinea TaxID=933095 RepID=A0AAI8VUA1_9PEZI|nr:Uu.00g063800.m01.CDS01 [Anthostomella pinea]